MFSTLPTMAFNHWAPVHIKESDESPESNVALDCGWGRVIFAHTFADSADIAAALLEEKSGQRDLAFYVQDPHVILSHAPQSLFLDPSHAYRLDFSDYELKKDTPKYLRVRPVLALTDLPDINSIYMQHGMMVPGDDFIWAHRASDHLQFLVAEDMKTGRIVGSVMGLDHSRIFKDPEKGTSLWALAVSKYCNISGVGEALIRTLVETYQKRGACYIDLSVLYGNRKAIHIYESLNFKRVPLYCIKHKNRFNYPLFTRSVPEQKKLNPYGQIIVNEAYRRGIEVELIDTARNLFKLRFAGRSVNCIESLTDLTSAVAFQRCSDKTLTSKIVKEKGVRVPAEMTNPSREEALAFLSRYGRVVVKPCQGEQGKHVFVDISEEESLLQGLSVIRESHEIPLIQEYVQGHDLRVIVIGGCFVAAAIRRPARVFGDGVSTVESLIGQLDHRRRAATGGESRVQIDSETQRCLKAQGFQLADVPPPGVEIQVRKTANLHTGGSIEDVTPQVHPHMRILSEVCARVLDIPVVGLDFIVPEIGSSDGYFIEANERPGLANHEPQPVVERFMDLLFPESML